MNREVHVRFCEGLTGKFCRPTHLQVVTADGGCHLDLPSLEQDGAVSVASSSP